MSHQTAQGGGDAAPDAPATPPQLFVWTDPRRRAALLVAQGTLFDREIAQQVGVTRRQVLRWKAHPLFAERVAALAQEQRAAVWERGITEKQARVADLGELRRRLWGIMDERAADPLMQGVPGGSTGLLERRTRGVGAGGQAIVEYHFDVALVRALCGVLKQAALEMGEWGVPPQTQSQDQAPPQSPEGGWPSLAQLLSAFADTGDDAAGAR